MHIVPVESVMLSEERSSCCSAACCLVWRAGGNDVLQWECVRGDDVCLWLWLWLRL